MRWKVYVSRELFGTWPQQCEDQFFQQNEGEVDSARLMP